MTDDINDILSGPIVPGHPLYASTVGGRIITDALIEVGLHPDSAGTITAVVIGRLAQHDPPILLGTYDEFKD